MPVASSCQPTQHLLGIADGCREADPLQRAPGETLDPAEQEEQMPAAVISGKGVQLVCHNGTQAAEQTGDVHPR